MDWGKRVSASLGKGTFGSVFEARHREPNKPLVVVKRLKSEHKTYLYEEVIALPKCWQQPNIVQVHDVFMFRDSPRYAIVFEEWGRDLHDNWVKIAQIPVHVRKLLKDVTTGVAYLHSTGLIHCDIKPSNILAKDVSLKTMSSHSSFAAKLADLGSCVAAAPVHRPSHELSEGNLKQTLNYRAPEVLLGCESYGAEVDSWSVGIIAAELGGCMFTRFSALNLSRSDKEKRYGQEVFKQLGFNGAEELSSLPGYSRLTSWGVNRCTTKRWPSSVRECLGTLGEAWLWETLSVAPSKRTRMCDSLCHAYFDHDDFPLFTDPDACDNIVFASPQFCGVRCPVLEINLQNRNGSSGRSPSQLACGLGHYSRPARSEIKQFEFKGNRHNWVMRVGMMSPEVLLWIRSDEALCPHQQAFQNLQVM